MDAILRGLSSESFLKDGASCALRSDVALAAVAAAVVRGNAAAEGNVFRISVAPPISVGVATEGALDGILVAGIAFLGVESDMSGFSLIIFGALGVLESVIAVGRAADVDAIGSRVAAVVTDVVLANEVLAVDGLLGGGLADRSAVSLPAIDFRFPNACVSADGTTGTSFDAAARACNDAFVDGNRG